MKKILATLLVGFLTIVGGALADADASAGGDAISSESGTGFSNTGVSTLANAASLGAIGGFAGSGGLSMAISLSLDESGTAAYSYMVSHADATSLSSTAIADAAASAIGSGPKGSFTIATTQTSSISILGSDIADAQSGSYSIVA